MPSWGKWHHPRGGREENTAGWSPTRAFIPDPGHGHGDGHRSPAPVATVSGP